METKRSYTLSIGGYCVQVKSEASPEEVNRIAQRLDRKINDIIGRDPSIPRVKAIIIAALDCSSDAQEALSGLQSFYNEIYGEDGSLTRLEEENRLLKEYIKRQGGELPELYDYDESADGYGDAYDDGDGDE